MFRSGVSLVALSFVGLACGGGSGSASSTDGGLPDGAIPDAAVRACRPVPPLELGSWQPALPADRMPLTLFVSPRQDTFFAIEIPTGRLLRSPDHGQTWCHTLAPPAPASLYFSADERVVYLTVSAPAASIPDGGAGPSAHVFRSDDGGDTWVDPGGTLPKAPSSLAARSDDPREMLATVPGELYSLWGTRDGGAHWEVVLADGSAPGSSLVNLRRHPARKGALYGIVTWPDAPGLHDLLMSRDGGSNWARVEHSGDSVRDYVFEDDGTLLVWTAPDEIQAQDLSGAWTRRGSAPATPAVSGTFSQDVVDPLYLHTVGAGMPRVTWQSRDRGSSWSMIYQHPPVMAALTPLRSGEWLVRDPAQLRLSADEGKSWRSVREFVPISNVTRTAAGTGAIFLYGDSSLSRSTDQGATWTTVPVFGTRGLMKLFPDPTAPDSYFATSFPRTSGGSRQLVRSRDTGRTWTPLPLPLPPMALPGSNEVLDFVVLPTSPPTLLAATATAIFRSGDDGLTWTVPVGRVEDPTVPAPITTSPPTLPWLRPAPSTPPRAYAVLEGALLHTTDAGLTWQNLPTDAKVNGVVVDPANADVFYYSVSGRPNLIKSGAGDTAVVPRPSLGTVALTPARPGVIYFIDAAGQVSRTSDDGKTITSLGLGLPARTLMFDPTHPDLLYATAAGLVKKVVD